MIKNIIAWDLGGTKCNVGLVSYQQNTQEFICKKTYSVKLADSVSLEDLVDQLELGLGASMSDVDAVCIAGAGQYDGESLHLEVPYPYPMPFAKIAKQRQWRSYDVIHDYAPIVCSTFTSYMNDPNNIKRLNVCSIQRHGRRVALGLGTGLGLKDGVLFPNGDFWLGRNEIGHIGITFPPHADPMQLQRHHELMRFLQSNKPVTFEKLLSGPGITRLYQFFYPNAGEVTPEQVGAEMETGKATEMLDAFAWYIGLFIGTVQLIFMPEGGIWITGGVALKHLDVFDRPDFFAGIMSSPAYYPQREQYPLGILCNTEHALIGGGYYAVKRLLDLQEVNNKKEYACSS